MNQEERLLLRPAEVAKLCGFSRAKVYELVSRGVLPSVRLGGGKSVRIPVPALHKLLDALVEGGNLGDKNADD